MAKVNGNLFLERVNGAVGDQMVLKRVRGGRTILCKKPTFQEDREFSEAQLAKQQVFREAAVYAKKMKREPVYLAIADGTAKTGYNVALGDWLNPPRILEIDLVGWNGAAGDSIHIRAQDDVQVVQVRVEIVDDTGAVLEAGEANDTGALWWDYRVSQPLSGELTVSVFASDLPGHVTQAGGTKSLLPSGQGGG